MILDQETLELFMKKVAQYLVQKRTPKNVEKVKRRRMKKTTFYIQHSIK